MTFMLHTNFSEELHVADLKLCKVLINNTFDFPWLFLIPMRPDIKQIHDLSMQDQYLLMDEINYCSRVMEKLFTPDQLNVAAIGNITPQLHVHIICRHQKDPYWPDVVWNKPMQENSSKELENRKNLIKNALS